MRKLLFISGLCFVFSIGAYAQDKDNKSKANTDDRKRNRRVTIVKMDNSVKLDTVSQYYPKPVPIPNALDDKPMAVKDISVLMPHKLLTGKESVVMPGTELVDKPNNKILEEHLKQIRPSLQDSVRKEIRPKK